MRRIVIIGGGASGLIAAIYAKKNNNEVIILERNNICGKKLLITGNGRCNYWNEFQSLENYNSSNKEILSDIINEKKQKEILTFFEKIGIEPKIKNGYYYPSSNQATSIKNALLLQTKLLNIKIQYNTLVTKITKDSHKFIINTTKEEVIADKIILATGSKACPKTGSDGIGYDIVKTFNHSIVQVVPALVQLRGQENYFKKWNGVRTDVKLTLLENDKKIKEESGEIQLTDYGISGICTFNISSLVSRGLITNKKEKVIIDFLPFLKIKSELEFNEYFDRKNITFKDRTIKEFLEGLINYKLVEVILEKSNINGNNTWINLNSNEKKKLYQNLIKFELIITSTNSFDKAQVCSGGVPLIEINPKTMESKMINNLYIAGEILDVDGLCGGFNLSFAWLSGMLAGRASSD